MSRVLRAIVFLVAALSVVSSAGPHAQNPTQVPQKQLVEDLTDWNRLAPYLRIVAAYRAGHVDEAAQDIVGWPQSALDEARQKVQRLRHRVVLCREATPAIDGRDFAGEIEIADLDAAVLLHTDAALRALRHGYGLGAQTQLRFAQALFEWTRNRDRDLHDVPGALLQQRTECHPTAALDSRDWHLAVSWALLLHWEVDLADGFAALGLEAAGDDAEVLLAAATIKEALALDATQYPYVPSKLPPRLQDVLGRPPQRNAMRSLGEALVLYRRALAVPPVYIQTHLRLGRVLSLLDQLDEARAELALVAAGADEAPERYLAELFLARVAEQAEDGDAAIAHYRQALDAWPESQAARIGLVHALGLADGGAGTSRALGELLAVPWPQPIVFDPWWVYPFGEAERGFRLLDQLRRRFVVTP